MFASLFTLGLLATGAFAIPSSMERHDARVARREGRARISQPLAITSNSKVDALATNASHVSYSSNWAGAVISKSTATWKSVTATFTVPTPKSTGGSSTQYASAWVGIDGDTCGTAILQTGLDFAVTSSGAVSYDAWYEWYPDYAYDFSGISISAGNTIKMTVTATSTGAGSAVIENVSTGKTVTHTFSGESNKLCETNAEWIVEDFESGNSLVPFANFGTVTFSGASATTSSGTVGVSGATIIDIKQGSTVLTDCSASGSSVTCSYV